MLNGNVSSSAEVELAWTASRVPSGAWISLDDIVTTDVNLTVQDPSNQIVSLVVRRDVLSMDVDGSAAFRFRLTGTRGALSSWAEVTVPMNTPPSLGWAQARPLNGSAINTTFTISAMGWVDEDLPMEYQFFSLSDGTQLLLSPVSLASSLSTVLSAGNSSDEYRFHFGATTTDAFGGSSTATNTTIVMPYAPPSDPAEAAAAAESMLDDASGDMFAVQSLAVAFSSSMGQERSSEALQMRETLVNSLAASVFEMANGTTAWTKDAVSGELPHPAAAHARSVLTAACVHGLQGVSAPCQRSPLASTR